MQYDELIQRPTSHSRRSVGLILSCNETTHLEVVEVIMYLLYTIYVKEQTSTGLGKQYTSPSS